MEGVFFLCLVELLYSFLSLSQLPAFYSLYFPHCEIALRVPVILSFLLVSLLSIFILFSQPFSLCHLFMSVSLPSLTFSACIPRVSQTTVGSTSSWSSVSSVTLWMIGISLLTLSLLFLCYTFIIVGLFSLLIVHFCKMSHTFFTRKQGGKSATRFAIYLHKSWVTDVWWLITERLCPVVLSLVSSFGREICFIHS